jgi:hypothetical protein
VIESIDIIVVKQVLREAFLFLKEADVRPRNDTRNKECVFIKERSENSMSIIEKTYCCSLGMFEKYPQDGWAFNSSVQLPTCQVMKAAFVFHR